MREIVGQEQPRPRWWWVGPICASVAVAVSTRDLLGGDAWAVLFVLQFAVLLVIMVFGLLLPVDRRRALVTDDALVVGRWWGVVTIARKDVRAVRGEVPNRPTWSDRVVVEHEGGEMRLPRYGEAPAVVIQRLQEWAGVCETAHGPPDGVTSDLGDAP
ncbi:hypothetical protein ACFVTZ_01480 [Cellulosimicrobium cellulans]|uniref:hypothetical protein n=1 Tax=Cellulosimicrobium cellulans TaxID=1710 RepID=UPI0036E963EA